MTKEDFRERTLLFGCNVISYVRTLPREVGNDIVGKQLIRSATSIGANYRAVCRARSRAEAIAKFGIVEEEADECGYWIDILRRTGQENPYLNSLQQEAHELLAMAVASIKTMKANGQSRPRELQ